MLSSTVRFVNRSPFHISSPGRASCCWKRTSITATAVSAPQSSAIVLLRQRFFSGNGGGLGGPPNGDSPSSSPPPWGSSSWKSSSTATTATTSSNRTAAGTPVKNKTVTKGFVVPPLIGNTSTTHNNHSHRHPHKSNSIVPVYVHPLSQIVLLYLQDQCHDWIVAHQIQALKIHRDGTFTLEFPPDEHDGTTCAAGIIWTFYDPMDKKHWLSFRKDNVQHRFLLQDHLLPTWNGNKRQSLPERIQTSVQEMLHAIEELQDQ